jgi:hypothetical protein
MPVTSPARLGNFRNVIECNRRIADDLGLAGEHRALLGSAAVVHLSADDGHAAGLALAGTAVVRDRDPAGKSRVDESLAVIGLDGLAVDDEIERTHTDHSGVLRRVTPA